MNGNLDLKQIKAKRDGKGTYSVCGLKNYTDNDWVNLGKELNESKALDIIRKNIPVSCYKLMEYLESAKRILYEINGKEYEELDRDGTLETPTDVFHVPEKDIFLILDTRLTNLFLKNYIEKE